MKALVIGATGATGKDLVELLLADARYTAVVTFVRRPSGLAHAKLTEVHTDFDQLETVSSAIKGDVAFLCLGTTLKAAGSKERQWHIDYEIPVKFAGLAKANGLGSVVLLSAYGASATSNVFYSQVKGKLEDKIASLAFSQYIIFRPGLLLRKETDRLGEKISAGLLSFLNGLGLMRKFKPMPTEVLAEKLAKAPSSLPAGKHIVELNKIFDF
ncbi:NAD(P)H-binding protein [Pedobacter sp. GSP4]|uniref:NAD(P)H-binding protein n=1 Tax=Pedobacter sp. GSP4 TaxID=3453716 RepID=UPI003EEDEE27